MTLEVLPALCYTSVIRVLELRMLGPIETTEQFQRLANAIDQRGLNGPAIMFLVATRPFRYVLNQLSVIAAPLLGCSNELGTSRLSWLLGDEEQFDHLISMLENPARIVRDEAER